jgi:TRAP-type C4-dicarboxylate transport system permease small subunit
MEIIINGLRFFLRLIWRFLCVMLVIIVIFMTIAMFLQITMRALGIQSFKWSEEVLRYSYIWVIFLGVPVGIYSNELTRFDLIQAKLSQFANKILETILLAVMLTVLFFMARGSFVMIRIQMRQMMTSLNIPMGIIYLSLPICAISSMLFLLAKVFLLWTGRPDLHEINGKNKTAEGVDAK